MPDRRNVLRMGGLSLAWASVGTWARADDRTFDVDPDFSHASTMQALAALSAVPAGPEWLVLGLPERADNGAFVPVTLESRLPATRAMYLIVEANPNPLAASFRIPDGTDPFVSLRIKMAESCAVHGVVLADGRWYAASKPMQVTVGGCN